MGRVTRVSCRAKRQLNSLIPVPCYLIPIPYSLSPIPYSLFPIPCSLFPVPYTMRYFSAINRLNFGW